MVGWSWLFPPYRWHFDARALDMVRAVAFDGACLRGKCDDDHTLGYELLGRFAPVMLERLQADPDAAPGRLWQRCLSRARWSRGPFRVERRRRETYDTWTLSLAPVQGEQLEVAPGQFTMLYAFGVGEVPISVSGAPLVQTIRAVGPGHPGALRLAARHGRRRARAVRDAAGRSSEAKGSDLLIVAGGVGLPPVRPALYHALEHRADYGRVILLYGARTPDDIVFRKEIERWRSRMDLEVDVTVDAASGRLAREGRGRHHPDSRARRSIPTRPPRSSSGPRS